MYKLLYDKRLYYKCLIKFFIQIVPKCRQVANNRVEITIMVEIIEVD